MKTIHINRNELQNGMCDIEKIIAQIIKEDLGVKKVSVTCLNRHWQGHICPSFDATADGVALKVFGEINPYDLEANPWEYDMTIDYILAD